MKKAGIFTIAIVVLAALMVLLYRSEQPKKDTAPGSKGTLVKEYKEWKKYYI